MEKEVEEYGVLYNVSYYYMMLETSKNGFANIDLIQLMLILYLKGFHLLNYISSCNSLIGYPADQAQSYTLSKGTLINADTTGHDIVNAAPFLAHR